MHKTRNKGDLSHSLIYCVSCCLDVKGR